MEKICGIYKITSPSGKIYIGQSRHIYKRWSAHKRDFRSNSHICNSIKKYGHENHIFEIIKKCNKKQLNKLESFYVDLYNSDNKNNGLNLRGGGNYNYKWNEELRMKRSEYELKHSIFKGRKMPESQKNKIRIANTGIKRSKDFKKRCSENNLGGKSPNAKAVINLQTGIYYEFMKEAAQTINMNHMDFCRKMRGERTNNTFFTYI